MELRQKAVLSEKLKSFIQSGNYESYVLDLMNQSQIVFSSQYERNPIQSAGECDFFDVATHEKYEAKLPFDKKEGELICRRDSDLKKWLEFMMDEEAEFGEKIIENRGKYKITDLRLYRNGGVSAKKDSIVDTISAMEFCFIYEKSVFAHHGKTEVADFVRFGVQSFKK